MRRRTLAPCVALSRPNTRTAPALGRSSVAQTRISVVLPTPFGPNSATAAPRSTLQSMSSRASVPPKRLLRCSTSSATGIAALYRNARPEGNHIVGSSPVRLCERGRDLYRKALLELLDEVADDDVAHALVELVACLERQA